MRNGEAVETNFEIQYQKEGQGGVLPHLFAMNEQRSQWADDGESALLTAVL